MEQAETRPYTDISNWHGITEYYDCLGQRWRIEKYVGDFALAFRRYNHEEHQWDLIGNMQLQHRPLHPAEIKEAHDAFIDMLYEDVLFD